MKKMRNCLTVIASVLTLSACGGGGSSGDGGGIAVVSSSLGGVVAVGAPIANAQVALICANGATKNTLAGSDGSYLFSDLTGCSAPYVLKAVGDVGGTSETLVSVLPIEAVGSTNVNLTPLTNAIAATLASDGDPLKLANDFANEKSRVTEAAVISRVTALKGALSGVLTTAGLPVDFDLLKTKFAANGTGFDKVLDNLKVDVKSTGVVITNASGVVVDDMKDSPSAAPVSSFASASITISNSTNFAAALPVLPPAVLDNSIADVFQTQLNECFAAASTSRGSTASLGSACKSLRIASDYLNDGRSASEEFDWRLSSTAFDKARVGKPEVIRYLSNESNDTRALISIPILRADSMPDVIQTVVERSTATGGALTLRGNQRPIFIDISGSVSKITRLVKRGTSVAGEKSTFFMTGLNIFLDYKVGCAGSNVPGCPPAGRIDYVKVTGPALPDTGVYLRNNGANGCDQYFTIMRDTTTSPYGCFALFQLNSRAATTSDVDNFGALFGSSDACSGKPCAHFANAKVPDDKILEIQPGSVYKFEVAGTAGNPSYTFYQRLRSRPYTMGDVATRSGEIDKIKWNEGISQSSLDSITPVAGASPDKLPALTVSYVRNLDAAPPFKTYIQVNKFGAGSLQVDSKLLPIDPKYEAGTLIVQSLRNSEVPWNNPQTNNANALSYNWIELVSRNKFGTLLDRMWRY